MPPFSKDKTMYQRSTRAIVQIGIGTILVISIVPLIVFCAAETMIGTNKRAVKPILSA